MLSWSPTCTVLTEACTSAHGRLRFSRCPSSLPVTHPGSTSTYNLALDDMCPLRRISTPSLRYQCNTFPLSRWHSLSEGSNSDRREGPAGRPAARCLALPPVCQVGPHQPGREWSWQLRLHWVRGPGQREEQAGEG